MTRNSGEFEQAVSRTLRDSLERLQRTTDELNQAIGDLVSACGSARPANSLPPMLRAQASAASLAASLEVLTRFVTAAMQTPLPTLLGQETTAPMQQPESPAVPVFKAPPTAHTVVSEPMLQSQPVETPEELQTSDMEEEGAPAEPEAVAQFQEPVPDAPEMLDSAPPFIEYLPVTNDDLPPQAEAFQISSLPPEEQELHRRANRVAKVSMQDIKMLRPDDLRLAKENKDICVRLRDDIEKAHKEYDRRFQNILGHPVDYFYDWMVQILGDGDSEALGEYPYPSPVLRR